MHCCCANADAPGHSIAVISAAMHKCAHDRPVLRLMSASRLKTPLPVTIRRAKSPAHSISSSGIARRKSQSVAGKSSTNVPRFWRGSANNPSPRCHCATSFAVKSDKRHPIQSGFTVRKSRCPESARRRRDGAALPPGSPLGTLALHLHRCGVFGLSTARFAAK